MVICSMIYSRKMSVHGREHTEEDAFSSTDEQYERCNKIDASKSIALIKSYLYPLSTANQRKYVHSHFRLPFLGRIAHTLRASIVLQHCHRRGFFR